MAHINVLLEIQDELKFNLTHTNLHYENERGLQKFLMGHNNRTIFVQCILRVFRMGLFRIQCFLFSFFLHATFINILTFVAYKKTLKTLCELAFILITWNCRIQFGLVQNTSGEKEINNLPKANVAKGAICNNIIFVPISLQEITRSLLQLSTHQTHQTKINATLFVISYVSITLLNMDNNVANSIHHHTLNSVRALYMRI